MDTKKEFAGDKKEGEWLLQSLEKKAISFLVPLVPKWLGSHHLTLMTIIWSAVIALCGFLAQKDISWLWLASLMIFFQYITDSLDGSVGRARNAGLIKWGYYMDHFLDYIFYSSIIFCYFMIFPESSRVLFIGIALIQIGFMVSSFLSFSATNSFSISIAKIGPTEIRILLIIFNIYLIFFGVNLPVILLPYYVLLNILALIAVVYRVQKTIWNIDMKEKQKTLN